MEDLKTENAEEAARALAIQQPHSIPVTRKAGRMFERELVQVIRDTVGRGLSDPELHTFLEIAARYNLSPFVGEIWAAKMPGKNGSPGRVAFIVGKAGMLKVAEQYPDYAGSDSDVVWSKDDFRVVRGAKGRIVNHSYGSDRGQIAGAWAEVYRKDQQPRYFYAPWNEYYPGEGRALKTPWGNQPSVMIEKCALSTALKLAFPISGIYTEGELAKAMADAGTAEPRGPEINWGENPELANRLQVLVEAANKLKPGSYLPAFVRVKLEGAGEDKRLAFAHEMERFIVEQGGEVPEPPVDAEAEEITDPVM